MLGAIAAGAPQGRPAAARRRKLGWLCYERPRPGHPGGFRTGRRGRRRQEMERVCTMIIKRENETEKPGRGASCANKLLVGGGKCQDADCKRVTRRARPSWRRPHRPGESRVRERGGIRTRGHVRALARAWSRRPPCWTWRTRGPEACSAGRSSPSAGIADRLKLHMHSAHRPRIRGTRPARRQGANRPDGPVGHRASFDGTPFRPGRNPCISAACRRQEVDIEVRGTKGLRKSQP